MSADDLYDLLEWTFDDAVLEGGNKGRIIEILDDALKAERRQGGIDEAISR